MTTKKSFAAAALISVLGAAVLAFSFTFGEDIKPLATDDLKADAVNAVAVSDTAAQTVSVTGTETSAVTDTVTTTTAKASKTTTKKTSAETTVTTTAKKKKTTKKTVSETEKLSETVAAATLPEVSETAPATTTSAVSSTTKATTTKKAVTTTKEAVTTTVTTSSAKTTTSADVKLKAKKKTTTTTPADTANYGEQEIGREIINYSEQKAMWISIFELQGILVGHTADEFRSSIDSIFRNCTSIGINTVYFQVRPFCDALYASKLFPWSKYASGSVGTALAFDPLAIAAETAHANGLSIHAWVNPYRAGTRADLSTVSDSYLTGRWYNDPDNYPEYVTFVESTGYCWLNPGIPEIRDLIADGTRELVQNYNIDGVHIDDYFYPAFTPDGFDDAAYSKYGSGMTLSDWRLSNCTDTVKQMYDAVKAEDSRLLFGIAPQGNFENNYVYMFADVSRWLENEGYCDYLAPQIYFGYYNQWKPFKSTLAQWCGFERHSSVKLVIGIAPANMELVDEFADTNGIVASQIADSFAFGADGIALFRYASLFAPSDGYQDRAAAEVKAVRSELT